MNDLQKQAREIAARHGVKAYEPPAETGKQEPGCECPARKKCPESYCANGCDRQDRSGTAACERGDEMKRGVAQGKERPHPKRKADGSSPSTPAKFGIERVAIGVESGLVAYMPVRQCVLRGHLGCLDRERREVRIHREQPEVGKHLILLHEMCHAAAEDLKAEGVIQRQPSEAFISAFAGRLFGMLALSGLWSGVTPEQVQGFFEGEIASPDSLTGTADDQTYSSEFCEAAKRRLAKIEASRTPEVKP